MYGVALTIIISDNSDYDDYVGLKDESLSRVASDIPAV